MKISWDTAYRGWGKYDPGVAVYRMGHDVIVVLWDREYKCQAVSCYARTVELQGGAYSDDPSLGHHIRRVYADKDEAGLMALMDRLRETFPELEPYLDAIGAAA